MATVPVNIFEFEVLAQERLSKAVYDSIAGGAGDEISLKRNRIVFDSIMLRPRMLVDISQRDLSTTVLGQRIEFPVMVAPAGLQGRAHPEGDLATVRAAGAVGTVMIVSSGSSYTLEEIAQAATGPIWLQQFLFRDRGLTKAFAQRAEDAGCTALCVTLNCKVGAVQERNVRNNYSMPRSPNYPGVGLGDPNGDAQPTIGDLIDLSATWSQLDWLAANTTLPLSVKGITTAEDARLCVEHGVKALIVSNRADTQVDTAFSGIEVLPEIVDAVDGQLEVYMDGGIRRGTDVLKALALGARAVLVGRAPVWGLAVDGEAGVRTVLQMLRDELDMAMGACGRPTIDTIDISLLGMVSPLIPHLRSARPRGHGRDLSGNAMSPWGVSWERPANLWTAKDGAQA